MQKFTFNEQGATDLLASLYALSNADLQLEANAAGADFRLWIIGHFEFTSTQVDFINDIDEQWINQAAFETKIFLEGRKPIKLHKLPSHDLRSDQTGDRGKLLDLDKKQSANYSEAQGYQESEELLYSISYTL